MLSASTQFTCPTCLIYNVLHSHARSSLPSLTHSSCLCRLVFTNAPPHAMPRLRSAVLTAFTRATNSFSLLSALPTALHTKFNCSSLFMFRETHVFSVKLLCLRNVWYQLLSDLLGFGYMASGRTRTTSKVVYLNLNRDVLFKKDFSANNFCCSPSVLHHLWSF